MIFSSNFNPRSPHGERLDRPITAFRAETISIHAPRTGSDHFALETIGVEVQFQSTLPARGATRQFVHSLSPPSDFNPRSPHGERRGYRRAGRRGHRHFNPRSPHGERHAGQLHLDDDANHFNPRSPHGERRRRASGRRRLCRISIHAPRTGSDPFRIYRTVPDLTFQSTLPARGATYSPTGEPCEEVFQSTLPARGATSTPTIVCSGATHFNPRSPHGERPFRIYRTVPDLTFQSTLPARGATLTATCFVSDTSFQSTLPARGATSSAPWRTSSQTISIHAPRTGSDVVTSGGWLYLRSISIHAPRTGSDFTSMCSSSHL